LPNDKFPLISILNGYQIKLDLKRSSSSKRSILSMGFSTLPTDNRTGNLSNKAPLTDMLLLVVKLVLKYFNILAVRVCSALIKLAVLPILFIYY
jgi:hypothetical protein